MWHVFGELSLVAGFGSGFVVFFEEPICSSSASLIFVSFSNMKFGTVLW